MPPQAGQGNVVGDVHRDAEGVEHELSTAGVGVIRARASLVKQVLGAGVASGGDRRGTDAAEPRQTGVRVVHVRVQGLDHEAGGGRCVAVLARGLVLGGDRVLELADQAGVWGSITSARSSEPGSA